MNIDFVIPGFSKCGTTTLCDLIGSHPDIFIPAVKEPGYFAENFSRGWEWYCESFTDVGSEKLRGEGSTTYSSQEYAEVACQRILERSPNCKFIFVARNPIDRLESSFREMHASGYKYGIVTEFQFGRALRQLPNMLADSKYWSLIQVYLRQVPRQNIHVLFLEDLSRDPREEIRRCCEFLEVRVDLSNIDLSMRSNAGPTKLCDTKLLRWIRTHKVASRYWNQIKVHRQARLMDRYKLRRSFDEPIYWDEFAKCAFDAVLRKDAVAFLKEFGKPSDFWDFSKADSLAVLRKAA
jgi:Sulfotransferase domain